MRRRVAVGILAGTVLISACTNAPAAVDNQTSAARTSAPTTTVANSGAAWTISGSGSPVSVVGNVVVAARSDGIVAVDRASGRELWHRDRKQPKGEPEYWVDGGRIVVGEEVPASSDPKVFEVVDAASGRTEWHWSASGFVVVDGAIYTWDCTGSSQRADQCSTTRHDIRDGRPTWPAPVTGKVNGEAIGLWHRQAPAEPDFLPIVVRDLHASSSGPAPWALVEAATGAVLPGRAEHHAWFELGVGESIVVTDHSPEGGSSECAVAIEATSARDGAQRWTATVHSGRYKNHKCSETLGPVYDRQIVGNGSRIAALTSAGAPQLFDLATGAMVWEAADPGTPIDADDRSMLVSEFADQGALSLLDMATGAKKWSVADPGFEGYPVQRNTFLIGDRVVVGGRVPNGPGHIANVTIVYDRETGREIARHQGVLGGAGTDWVAVVGDDGLEFHT
ncbi:PQQ-binding-like beta-propeller repeat protein [Nocardia sp. NPDC050710]|uniref:outer membrane protein assembly factor BamB family protein n=1 Tax=Nocardia sp. NPDC050710 TaxID=3157220 RepID=UPI00340993A5